MIARASGTVRAAAGELVQVALPGARVGDAVCVRARGGARVLGEIVAVRDGRATAVPHASTAGIGAGARVESWEARRPQPFASLGRAFAPGLVPLDGGPPLRLGAVASAGVPRADARAPVVSPFRTGVRAIDALLTIGRGARCGIFGAPGAGKSTLLETIVRESAADATVLALIGERGREAERWLARRTPRTTIVCATGDRCASERIEAAELAMAQAEALRDAGLAVLLVVDSLARYASALRERATALGEPPGRGGYPPSVWAMLARYVERAGMWTTGSITAFFTVLSDGADEREPLSENARAVLDGHLVLSSELARAGRFPAIDVLASASRTMPAVAPPEHCAAANVVRRAMALLERTRDARELGLADLRDPSLSRAVELEPRLVAFLSYGALAGGAARGLLDLAQALGA